MLPPMGDTAPDDREYPRPHHPGAGRRPRRLRPRARRRHRHRSSGRGGDPISALTALLTGEGALASWCSHRYELRLHKARGYGALKAILEILAEEEPLTLTEVAQRLHRTPGSTKDYLSWLEDVDLIVSRQKRYSFADPLTRLWVRLHCRPVPPSVDEVAREVQGYAMARLPHAEPVHGNGDRRRRRIPEGFRTDRDRLIRDQGSGIGIRDQGSGLRRSCRSVSFGGTRFCLWPLPLPGSSAARWSRGRRSAAARRFATSSIAAIERRSRWPSTAR